MKESLRRLKVLNAGHLVTEDVWALAGLGVLEELELEGAVKNECLRVMCEDSGVVQALRSVVMRMQAWRPDEETVGLLCEIEIRELVLYCMSMRTVELLFLRAPGGRLAGRLQKLELHVSECGRAGGRLEEMPFVELEDLCLYLPGGESVEDINVMLGDGMKAKVGTLFVGREPANRTELVSLVSALGNLAELILMHSELEKGDMCRILAEKSRIERITLYQTAGRRIGIGAEDALLMTQLKSLKRLTICSREIDADVLETIFEDRAFVQRLERLKIFTRVRTVSAETGRRLRILGIECESGSLVGVDTGTIEVLSDR